DWIGGKIQAQKLHAASRGSEQAREHLDGRGFSGAVRPEKTKELAGNNLKINGLDGREIPEGPRQLVGLNGHLRHRVSRSKLENQKQNSNTSPATLLKAHPLKAGNRGAVRTWQSSPMCR